jgi:lipid II:glycine glycyltransferase (peptidoglycan interpeptide bridge formation enzyme)
VDENTWKYLEIRPTFFEPGIETGMGKTAAYFFHRLILEGKSSEALFHGLHKDCIQRKIRRAEREGLQYEEGRSEELLKKFYHLLLLTRRRQGLPPQPLAWFRNLAESFGDNLKIRVASKNQVPVSSILTISFGRTMTYKYGCSDENLNKYGGMAFLMWKAVEDAKNCGLDELDLGRSDINNEGLAVFKDRLGAARSVMHYWRFPKSDPAAEAGWKTRFARQLVSVAPDSSLAAAGNLLYRHFG